MNGIFHVIWVIYQFAKLFFLRNQKIQGKSFNFLIQNSSKTKNVYLSATEQTSTACSLNWVLTWKERKEKKRKLTQWNMQIFLISFTLLIITLSYHIHTHQKVTILPTKRTFWLMWMCVLWNVILIKFVSFKK